MNRLNNNLLGLFVGRHFSLLHRLVDVGEGFGFGFGLHVFDQHIFSLFTAHAADLLQVHVLLLEFALDLIFFAFNVL